VEKLLDAVISPVEDCIPP